MILKNKMIKTTKIAAIALMVVAIICAGAYIKQSSDAKKLVEKKAAEVQKQHAEAQILFGEGKYFEAMRNFRNVADYKDGRKQYNLALEKQKKISAGSHHSLGLRSDGTVVATIIENTLEDYGHRNVTEWKDIVAISPGSYHNLGLRSDGSVVAVGNNKQNQCNVSGWKLN